MTELIDLVEIRQGTASTFEFSNGNTLPLIGAPFAMCNWAPQTSSKSGWFYHPQHRKFQGMRATRQPSPWIADYGNFTLMPQTGARHLSSNARASAFRPQDVVCGPDYFCVDLLRDRCKVELTATDRCSILRVSFNESAPKRLIIEAGAGMAEWSLNPVAQTISGIVRANSGGVPANFGCYVYAKISCGIDAAQSGIFSKKYVRPGLLSAKDADLGCWLEFDAEQKSLEVRVGTSFISLEQARQNLEQEIDGKSFEEVRTETRTAWNKQLSVIEIHDADVNQQRKFYSALYRCFLFPRQIHEITKNGMQHYSPYDGKIHAGPLYADNGFWDTHRTVYPLFSILCPNRLEEIIAGWINAYKEGGWFPKWSSPGYRPCMIGTHIDAVIADAYVKGVNFDVETAFEGLCKHAFQESDGSNNHGRIGLRDYIELGWVPNNHVIEAASRTMDFAYNDWCIAQIAAGLGETNKAEILLKRAKNYKNVFDKNVGFMRGKNSDGTWHDNGIDKNGFSTTEWGGPFVEGAAWQCGWAVPHDVDGLIELMGGKEKFVEKLDLLLATPPYFEIGSYDSEIHEMSEMAAVDFGQYAQSNQPVHHILYLYALAGRADRTQYWVRKVCEELYSATPEGFPGDEDNGEMSAWFVFSALGFYPVCPGKPAYVLGCPLFSKTTIHLENGNSIVINAEGDTEQTRFGTAWQLNGNEHKDVWIQHEDLMNGANFIFD